MRSVRRSSILLVFVSASLCMVPADRALAMEAERVLVLHSYGLDFRWTLDMDTAIRDVLERPVDSRVSVYSETLDAKYHTGREYLETVRDLLARKYEGWSFDLLMVTDNFALEFARLYQRELWPDTPLVFAGINNYDPAQIAGFPAATGVAEDLSPRATINLMRELFPDCTSVFVLTDGTLTGEINLGLVKTALAESNLRAVTQNPTTLDSLEVLAREIGPENLVLLVGLVLDENGDPLAFDRSGRIVSRTLPAPVFSLWDFYMETGIAGGFMTSGREQGRLAAQLAGRILAGEDAASIPVVTESPNVPTFDLAVLGPYGVTAADLPSESVIYNAPVSIWREYRFEIISVSIAFTLLTALVALAYQTARRRGQIARATAETLREKEILLREIHHRVKNNLQVVSSMLSIQSTFIDDETSLGYFQDCRTRIQSMALVHEHLYRSTSLARIEMRGYVDELVATVTHSMELSPDRIRIETEIDDVSTDLDQAIPLGMVINELLSNAIKYAYPDREGTVRVSLLHREGRLFLSVEDHGVGADPGETEQRDSLGLQLVEALSRQLGGVVRYENNAPGLRVAFDFPLVVRDLRDRKEIAT